MDLLLGQEAGTWIGLVSSQVKEQRQFSQFRSPFIVSGGGRSYIGTVRISPDWSVNSLTLISLVAGKDW